MCGIVGIFRPYGARVVENEIKSMLDRILYRGPDGSGMYVAEGIGFGHARLAIQDLSLLAAQPMISHNKRYVLTYNGEVYNVRELQKELKEKGVVLKSTGDTEALLEYLSEFGVEATLAKIEGMFAFALWDQRERNLVLARDRHGVKPLYYTMGPRGEVRFASEMKSLICSQANPDLCTLNATLLGFGGTCGDSTVFRGVRHVGPGEWLVFGRDIAMKRRVFFTINDFVDQTMYDELRRLSKEEVVNKVKDALEESIELRLISDAPVGSLVSGGVDSSLIVAMAMFKGRSPGLKLYHANVISNSEISPAQHLSQTLGLKLQSVNVSDEDILDNTPIVTYHYEIPIIYHSSSVPFYMVSKLAGQDGIKVLLTGEASDEYFLGYPIYSIQPYLLKCRQILGFLRNLLHKVPAIGNLLRLNREADSASSLIALVSRYERERRRTEAAKRFSFIRNKKELFWHVKCIDLVIGSVSSLLHRNDRLAMAWGIESRFPFLGYHLARIAANLPGEYKIRKTLNFSDWRHPFITDKWVVRKIAERYLPAELAHRAKYPFRSSVYQRLNVDKQFFQNGFMAEYYGLDNRAIDCLFDTAAPLWLCRLMLLEVWGQIFPLGCSVDAVRDHLRRYVTIKS